MYTDRVPYLSDALIEHEAEALLRAYALHVKRQIEPPIPIDGLVEFFLKLPVEMDDLCYRYDGADILGALYLEPQRVRIDVRLDPILHPGMLGRYRFTLGHEAGHWQLHRDTLSARAAQSNMFTHTEEQPDVICRESQRRDRIEFQADRFSACLLMPRKLIAQSWLTTFGDSKTIVSTEEYERVKGERAPLFHHAGSPDRFEDFEADLFRHAALELAPEFEVSGEAMQYRLQELGLLVRTRTPEFRLERDPA